LLSPAVAAVGFRRRRWSCWATAGFVQRPSARSFRRRLGFRARRGQPFRSSLVRGTGLSSALPGQSDWQVLPSCVLGLPFLTQWGFPTTACCPFGLPTGRYPNARHFVSLRDRVRIVIPDAETWPSARLSIARNVACARRLRGLHPLPHPMSQARPSDRISAGARHQGSAFLTSRQSHSSAVLDRSFRNPARRRHGSHPPGWPESRFHRHRQVTETVSTPIASLCHWCSADRLHHVHLLFLLTGARS